MRKEFFTGILKDALLPFIKQVYPDGHRYQQDKDPKHTSILARNFRAANNINHWPTPPESPDLNPIEMLWAELKHFMRRKIKPRNKDQLIHGILKFWRTVTAGK